LYLAAMTAITVFVIAVAYNQVIELFPSGGGGYKVATRLLGAHAGLVSGSALVVDYVLTIAISVASGVDALFSLLPPSVATLQLGLEVALTVLLLYLNLRGMKESIRFLLPIFIGFVVTHTLLIGYGGLGHGDALPSMIGRTRAGVWRPPCVDDRPDDRGIPSSGARPRMGRGRRAAPARLFAGRRDVHRH